MKYAALALLIVPAVSTLAMGQPVESRGAFSERYGVLTEGNIFLRDRARGRSSPTTVPSTQPAAAPLTPEQALVLTGIVFEEGEFRAYFENLKDPAIVRVAAGEAVARGHIAEIAIDAVAFELEGQTSWVEVGKDLTGAAPTFSRPVVTGSTAAGSPTTGTAAPAAPAGAPAGATPGGPAGGGSSMAEQMRQRRLQELNRGR